MPGNQFSGERAVEQNVRLPGKTLTVSNENFIGWLNSAAAKPGKNCHA